MAYWDKKEEKQKPQVTETLEDFEKEEQQAIEDEGKYLSRKIKETANRMNTVVSDGFYFVVYFNNDEQKEGFLQKLGFNKTARFLKGKDFARAYNMKVEQPDFEFGDEKKPVPDFANRARRAKYPKRI